MDNSEPEIIKGLGQFKAGRGAIVTGWHATRDEALAAYHQAVLDAQEQQEARTWGTQGWAETYSDNLGESPDY